MNPGFLELAYIDVTIHCKHGCSMDVGERIHEQLRGNPHYINSGIVLNCTDPDYVRNDLVVLSLIPQEDDQFLDEIPDALIVVEDMTIQKDGTLKFRTDECPFIHLPEGLVVSMQVGTEFSGVDSNANPRYVACNHIYSGINIEEWE